LYDDEEIRPEGFFSKRCILNWELKNDSLYIVDYHPASDYQGKKTKEDVRKDIERFWGKTFINEELKANWIVGNNEFFVRDKEVNVYSLRFQDSKFVEMEERNDLIVRKLEMKHDKLKNDGTDYPYFVDKMRRAGFDHGSMKVCIEGLGLTMPEALHKTNKTTNNSSKQ
jgi:hypothetical protein